MIAGRSGLGPLFFTTALAVGGAACSGDDVPTLPPAGGGSGTTAGTSGQSSISGAGGMAQPATAGTGGAIGGSTSQAGQSQGGAGGGAGTTAGSGGAIAGSGGSAGSGGGSGGLLPGNPPRKSGGCDKPAGVTSGKKTIKSSNEDRSYIIDIPANYDMTKPHRLFYTSHWIDSTAEAVQDQDYYFLKPLATAANEPAIFVAPQSTDGRWHEKDHVLFDNLLTYVKQNLCIDETRVFATGFSFGGMITYSLSVNHQKDIRAAVGIGPANYNIYVPTPKSHAPIAWMQTTGLGDDRTPWVHDASKSEGAKFIAIERGTDNGCMVPTDIPTWKQGDHLCYDFAGCKPGYPTKVCTFDGGHTNIDVEAGKNWIAEESWKFFKQF